MQKRTDPVFDTSRPTWAEWLFIGIAVCGVLWFLGLIFAIKPLVDAGL